MNPIQFMRSITLLILTLFVFASKSHAAEIIQAQMYGTQMISGEILGIRADTLSILVKIRTAAGVEHEISIGKVNPQSLSKVVSWMSQTARAWAGKNPQIRISSSDQTANKIHRSPNGESSVQTTRKTKETSHTLTIVNTSATAVKDISLRRVIKQVVQDPYQNKGRKLEPLWIAESLAAPVVVQPGEVRSFSFMPLLQTSEKAVTLRSLRSMSGASMGKEASVQVSETKIEAIYLLAFDGSGTLIYFAQF